MKRIEFSVVGFKFNDSNPNVLMECDTIELIPEPENPFDPNAVKVIVDGKKSGHIASKYCKRILNILQEHIDFSIGVMDIYPASARCELYLDDNQ